MAIARKALVGLAWLYVLGVAVQFFLAGLGLPELGGEGMEAHEGFGYSALHLTPILFIILAVVGKAGRNVIGLTVVFAVIAFVQPIWAVEFQGEFLASMHILGALVIFALAHMLAKQATQLLRSESAT
jgi:hypothetical protein